MRLANLTFLMEQNNYGQRLQNYALQRFFEREFGEKLVTVDCDRWRRDVSLDDGRNFHRFEKECLNLVKLSPSQKDALDGYDRIVVGGDQVLNTNWRYSESVLFPFIVNRSRPRRNVFFYGAGVPPEHEIKRSVRESLALHVIAYGLREDCRRLDYVKNIDPVFLIRDLWPKVAAGVRPLGGTVEYLVENGCASLLAHTSADGKRAVLLSGKTAHPPDPREFVGLFQGAEKVVTNSFHGFSFALMARVPHVVSRNISDHRVVNLINMLGVRFEGDRVANYDEILVNADREAAKAKEFVSLCLSASPRDYCAFSKSPSVRCRSSSGGVCAEAARLFYSAGGVVLGGAYSPDFRKVECVQTRSMDEYFARLSKSKYSFCQMPSLSSLQTELGRGKPVLYIGSPCHVRGLKTLLSRRGIDARNLVCIDFRCRGYSKPGKFAAFVDRTERNSRSKVVAIDFRPNHASNMIAVRMASGTLLKYGEREWGDFVFTSLPMCAKCTFAHGFLSCADLTVGDFWENKKDIRRLGADFTPERGCCIVSVNTPRGQELWNALQKSLSCREVLMQNRPS